MKDASQPTPKRGAPRGARSLGTLAARAVEDAIASLITAAGKAEGIDRQAERIDRWADQGAEAMRQGNRFTAEQMFLNIRNATATQRHAAAEFRTLVGDAKAALADARAGRYGE